MVTIAHLKHKAIINFGSAARFVEKLDTVGNRLEGNADLADFLSLSSFCRLATHNLCDIKRSSKMTQ